MKKILFLLIVVSFINVSFSQDISGAKPILSIGGTNISPNRTFKLGCNIESMTVDASYNFDIGSTDHYRVEEIPYHSKGDLLTSGTTVLSPASFGLPGQIISNLTDDQWSSKQQLASNGSDLEFCYFEEPKTEFVVSSNGILSFDTSYANQYSSWTVHTMGKIDPDANCGDNKDAILQLHDTNPADSDADWNSYSYWLIGGTGHERYLQMGVHHMPMYSCGADNGYANHQMVLYETTNIIEYNIKDKPICEGWANGWQAFGIQNKDQTVGYAVPGLDNFTHKQILNSSDSYNLTHYDSNYPVEDSRTIRFIPDGVNVNPPDFGWYINWDNVTHTGTLFTSAISLTVAKDSLTVDANGDPIPIVYTAVVRYEEPCSGEVVYSINNVTFELDNPIQMHIQEQDSPDDTIEYLDVEEINLCNNEDYTLTAMVQDADPTSSFKLEWTVESFGNPVATIQVDDPVTSDGNGDINVDLFIDHTLTDTLTPGVNYTYTCTLTDGTCIFSDSVIIKVLNNASFAYSPIDFCASDADPIPQNIVPALATPPAPYDSDYYFTIDNGGVWLAPEADATISLDGVPDLSECFANATTFNANGSASFVITYHGGCVDNTIDVTITITDAPIVLNPEIGDPTATPVIEPSPLITLCETDSVSQTAEFDLDDINNYIANGSTGLQFDWITVASGTSITPADPTSYTSTTKQVQVTVTNPSAPASCPVVLTFYLRVVQKPVITTPIADLKQCENNLPAGTAEFFGANLESEILGTLDPTLYTVHYAAVDVNGDPVTQIYVGGVAQAFESPLPTYFNVESVTVTAYVTLTADTTESCPSEDITFDLVVKEIPIVTVPSEASTPPAILKLCETDIVNHAAGFDTSNWNTIVLSGNSTPINPDYLIEYDYVDMAGAPVTGVNTMPNPFPSKSQTITVRVINTPSATGACPSLDYTFDLEVIETPTNIQLQNSATTPLILCEDDTNADPLVHTALFDTAAWNDYILNRPTIQNSAAYFVEYTYVDANGNTVVTNGSTVTLPTNLELSSQTIQAIVKYKIDDTTFCSSDVKTFDVTVINTPIVAAVPTTNIILCETDAVNHTAEFDTTSWESTILGGTQPAANYYVSYTAVEVADDGTETPYVLPNPLTATITVPDIKITVTVSYDITAGVNSTCTSTTNEFYLEVIEKPVATLLVDSTETPIILCETNTVTNEAEFDTTNWNSTILGADQTTGYDVEYTAFTVDPVTFVETPYALPLLFPEAGNISTLPSLKIYIKVFYDIDATTRCESDETFFFITSNPSPAIEVPTDAGFPAGSETLEMCESDTDADPDVHMATFDTNNWLTTILAGQTSTNYHVVLTAVDLNGDTVTLPDPLPTSFETESIVITALVTDDNIPCDSVEKEFKLDVKVIPINNVIPDMVQCESDDINHTSIFNTANWTSTVIGSQDPTNLIVEYTYLDAGVPTTVVDGDVVTTTLPALPANITTTTQTVSVVIKNENSTISCANPVVETFELKVINTPTNIQLVDSTTLPITLTLCEDDANSDVDVHTALFDTTNWTAFILNRPVIQNDAAYFVEYTYVDANGSTVVTDDTNIISTSLELNSQTIQAIVKYKIDSTTFCESDVKTFDVTVINTPIVDAVPTTEITLCETDTVTHTAEFDTSLWESTILGATQPAANYYITYTAVEVADDGTETPYSLPTPFPEVGNSSTLPSLKITVTVGYDIVSGVNSTCSSAESVFNLTVNKLPVGVDGLVVVCSGSTDYITVDDPSTTPPTYKDFTFDDFAMPQSSNGNSDKNTYQWIALADNPDVTGESLSVVDSGDVDNPTITDTLKNNTQVVQYVIYEVIPFSEFGCEGEPFNVTVQVDVAPDMSDQTTVICNEEQVNFDFDVYTSLTGNTYRWYAIENNEITGESTSEMTTSIIDDTIINISGVEQIVEYVVTPKSVGGCEGNSFTVFVTVNPRPDFELKPQYFICPEDGSVMIGEDINSDDYIYYWFRANNLNVVLDEDHPKQYEVTEADLSISNGNYVLTVEDKYTHCIYSQFTTVSMAEQMAIASIHVSDFNTPDNTITITMAGTGVYEYTLHYTDSNGVSQTITQNSPIFEHLDANTYQIEVTDLNNCSINIFSNDVYVLDAPPFFTPNGDGENDTWSIIGANVIINSEIYVFDRYGKVLARINPNNLLGWDGTFEGVQVTDSEYWFSVEYVDPNTGVSKVVKGHFSLVLD